MATLNYNADLDRGHEFQDFAAEQLLRQKGIPVTYYTAKQNQYTKGESVQGIEIKLDKGCTKYQRLSIEVEAMNKQGEWFASGIHYQDGSWLYCQGNEEVIWAFSKRTLQRYQQHVKPQIEEWKTVRKFYLTFEQADRLCEFKITPQAL